MFVQTGGQSWPVPAGRRDGRVSISSEVPENLMTPDKKVPVLLQAFQKKGLNAAQMVTLQGTFGHYPSHNASDRSPTA